MASALTVLFLSCWLAGQSRVQGQGTDPAGPQQPDPPTTAPQGENAGSASAKGTDPTPLETLSTPSSSATDAGSTRARGSDSTLLETLSAPSPSTTHAGSIPTRGTHLTPLETTSAPSPCATDAGSTPTSGTSTTQQETPSDSSPSATDAGSTPTRGPISGQSGSEPNGAIVAGVIVGAAGLLLLLLLGFLCRRRTRAREGPASRQSRESEAATTVYALAGLGKQQDVPKPDPGAEGLTYTELDRQALQAKRDAQVPAPEPVLYVTVSGSQGAPQPPP